LGIAILHKIRTSRRGARRASIWGPDRGAPLRRRQSEFPRSAILRLPPGTGPCLPTSAGPPITPKKPTLLPRPSMQPLEHALQRLAAGRSKLDQLGDSYSRPLEIAAEAVGFGKRVQHHRVAGSQD